MKRISLAVLAGVGFVGGLVAPAAYADVRIETDYVTVAGGASSCTMVKSSINSTNRKAGGKTGNFKGCSSSNAWLAMPTGYLKVEPYIIDQFGETCSYYNPYVSPGAHSSVEGTAAIEKPTCQSGLANVQYSGYAIGGRKTANGTWSYDDVQSGWLVFN